MVIFWAMFIAVLSACVVSVALAVPRLRRAKRQRGRDQWSVQRWGESVPDIFRRPASARRTHVRTSP